MTASLPAISPDLKSAVAPTFSWAGLRVLVTGGTGFIGYHLLERLLEAGARPIVLVRDAVQANRLEELRSRVRLVEGDLRASLPASTCRVAFAEGPPQIVFHLAAAGVENPVADWRGAIEANISGTAQLLQLCGEWDERPAFVYAGTPFEYGVGSGARCEDDELKPPNFYAASKAAGWLFCQTFAALHDLPVVGVRPFLTYGPHQGARRLVPATILAALRNEAISLTGGTQSRDFVYIDDVVDGLMKAASALSSSAASTCRGRDVRGEMFNLGSGTGHALQFVVERILALSQSSARPSFGALPFRKGDIWDLRADTTKTHEMLGWQAQTDLDEGLARTIAWYRDNLHQFSL